ncbi:PREDICTED: uncharacterized protein LOC108971278 [Bactrocera latifrons]|uniref:uncharacterized protein LOC108971278 n=1 Tax=Bactrocera latifrons TaxID=174628 RepID=UPI0008DD13C3|nr:PREDICTED: uncharacterized protein LOC108971278 [Bactrocera latifrons]
MNEIFGESCLVSKTHTINIGTDSQEALVESSGTQSLTDLTVTLSLSRQSQSALSRSMCRPNAVYPQEPNAANPVQNPRYRKSAKERYFDQKIELKRKSSEEKAKFYAKIENFTTIRYE